MIQQGFHDTFECADAKDSGVTVVKKIDGWEGNEKKIRIDYIFMNQPIKIQSSKTIFNQNFYPIISDHFGVMVQVDEI